MKSRGTSLLFLFGCMTLAAILVWLIRLGQNDVIWASWLASIALMLLLHFFFFALFFFLVYPLGVLDKMIEKQAVQPQTPFADGRLPEQLVPLRADHEKAH